MRSLMKFVILAVIAYIAYSGYSVWTYGDNVTIPKADAAIVLGAAQWNGQPSPVLEGRLKQGIELYKEDKVNYLVLTGGKSKNATVSEAEAGRNYAVKKGIPKRDILYENKSSITKGNLLNAKKVSKPKGIDSYLLVSDQYHLKRATSVAESHGMEVTAVPTKYSAYQTMETKLPFFLREWAYLLVQNVRGLF